MRWWGLVVMAAGVLALGAVSVFEMPKRLIYNGSASAPLGFYWADHGRISRGDFVFTRLPKWAEKLIERRGYLPPGVPLIKRVVGMAGDEICRQGREVFVNGIAIAIARMRDEAGRKMPVWQGCRILSADEVFLLQEHPRSFDGRYFGPINRRFIISRVKRLRSPCSQGDQE